MMHWSVQSGPSWSPKVAWIELQITTCTNGRTITKTLATGDSNETGPGITAGFRIRNGPPALVAFDSGGYNGGHAAYYMGASLRDCLPGGITIWCSPAYDFSVRGKVIMRSAIWWSRCVQFCRLKGPNFAMHHRVFHVLWWWVCKNDNCQGCGIRLNGKCKG